MPNYRQRKRDREALLYGGPLDMFQAASRKRRVWVDAKNMPFDKFVERCCRDLLFFAEYGLGFTPTWQQRRVLEAVQAGHKRIAVKSGQGPGKSKIAGVVGLWRAFRRRNALTVVTAPTMRQCKEVYLAELRKTMEGAHPFIKQLVKITNTRVTIDGEKDWGIQLATATNPESIQGFHNDHLTFILEEASGIPMEIVVAIEGTLSQATGDVLDFRIGNPNTRDCQFFFCFNLFRDKWWTFTMNAEESPIVSDEHCKDLADTYGRASDIYRVRVLGEFPHKDPNCVLSSEDLEACTETDLLECVNASTSKQFGLDYARFGSDESVIYQRSGLAIIDFKVFAKTEPLTVTQHAFQMQNSAGWKDKDVVYVPDSAGIGGGGMGAFYSAGKRVHEFQSNHKTPVRQYADKATEAWFEFGKYAADRRVHIPQDAVLIQQLAARQYQLDNKGRFKLESKKDYCKRTGQSSPDRADALIQAFYEKAQKRSRVSR